MIHEQSQSQRPSQQSGFITTIVLIVVGIIVLKFWFHIDVISYLTSGAVGEWLAYVKKVIVVVWDNIIHPLFVFIKNLVDSK